jgi:hypothetical protein
VTAEELVCHDEIILRNDKLQLISHAIIKTIAKQQEPQFCSTLQNNETHKTADLACYY